MGVVRAADRVRQRFDPADASGLPAAVESGLAVFVHLCSGRNRRVLQQAGQIALDVGKFLGGQQALEDVEAVAPIGIEDRRVERAVRAEAERAPIVEGERPRRSGFAVTHHFRFGVAVVDRRGFVQGQGGHSRSGLPFAAQRLVDAGSKATARSSRPVSASSLAASPATRTCRNTRGSP